MNPLEYTRPKQLLDAGGAEQFGIRSARQLLRDYQTILKDSLSSDRFQLSLSSLGHLRPGLSIPAYLGFARRDGLSPIMNLFDRTGGGVDYSQRVSRDSIRDFRGGTLGYDEHDGIDFVCPPGTPLCAAASGTVVYHRDNWLRGGLTIIVDHGSGLITQYTHCTRALKNIGDSVRRGEAVAISGTSGVDMTTFFPLVPPHIHFSVWDNGRPVDPFQSESERRTHGVWANRNQPLPVTANEKVEAAPKPSKVDEVALDSVIADCLDDRLRDELERARDEHGVASAAALAEDALHHDRYAWHEPDSLNVRPVSTGKFRDVTLSLPLPDGDYRGAFFCDTRWTRPSS